MTGRSRLENKEARVKVEFRCFDLASQFQPLRRELEVFDISLYRESFALRRRRKLN